MGPIIGAFLYLPLAKKIQPENEKITQTKTAENGNSKKRVKTKRKKILDKDKRD
jgi:hypothetical protein